MFSSWGQAPFHEAPGRDFDRQNTRLWWWNTKKYAYLSIKCRGVAIKIYQYRGYDCEGHDIGMYKHRSLDIRGIYALIFSGKINAELRA